MCKGKKNQSVKTYSFLLTISLMATAKNLLAAEAEPVINKLEQAGNMSGAYLGQFVVGLLVVLLCIVALAWIAKRFNRLQSSVNGELQVLGGLSMGARERIVLVKVGDEQLLLGVSPGRINALHVMPSSSEKQTSHEPPSFGKNLSQQLTAALSKARL